jgi:hypothetical protein
LQSVDVDIDITGADKLYLVVSSEDINGYSNHNCNWINPEVTGPGKKLKLTELSWVNASSGRGKPMINQTFNGGKLKVNNNEYNSGLNVNAVSIIEYDLPEGVTTFRALAGLQSGMSSNSDATRQNNGKFMIFTSDPSGPEPGSTAEISVNLGDLGLSGSHEITDLWSGEKLGEYTGMFTRSIQRHGAGLYRIH